MGVTQRISLAEATWCPGCGALVAPGEKACPKCGSSLVGEPTSRQTRDIDLPEIGNTGVMEALSGSADETGVMTRIESAIPSAGDESSPAALHDSAPRPRALLLAGLLAVVVVGGAALLITHPWDPTASQTRATEPADTSMSGFPGVLDSLSGQDASSSQGPSDGSGADDPASEESPLTPLEELAEAHASLRSLSDRVDQSEADLRDVGVSGTPEERSSGLSSMTATSIEVSNLISSISAVNDGDGAFADTIQNLVTLGNWLRNRCDALAEAWQRSVDAEDPAASSSYILAPLDGTSDYARLFEENYDAWAPAADVS